MLVRILTAAIAAPSLVFITATASINAPRLTARTGLRLVVAPEGNEVRYRVREQLAGFDLPNDAVGRTAAVTGGITFDTKGGVVPAASKVEVNVDGLTSDRSRRDGYVRARVLDTAQYPTVTLAPTAITGLTWPLPTSGSRTFQLIGDLTVRGTTHATTWNVTATFNGSDVTGTAITGFTFGDFGLAQPRVPVVLSVADSIHLEYEFHMVPEGK